MTAEKPGFDLKTGQRDVLRSTLIWVKNYFDNVPPDTHIGGHGFDKTLRQAGMAAVIASGEGHSVFLPVLTAMVMDVGRAIQDPRSKNFQHGELSREMIDTGLLSSLTILTLEDKILIGNAVEDHSKLNENVRRSDVVEAVMDADRLDCLGALGPLRSASWRPNIPLILPEETATDSGAIPRYKPCTKTWPTGIWNGYICYGPRLPRVLQYPECRLIGNI